MTNFFYLLNLDNPGFHNLDDEAKDRLVIENYENVESQLLQILKNTRSFDEKLSDQTLRTERFAINKRLENGPRLYYAWLRYLSFGIARDFLKNADLRKTYAKLASNNSEKEDDKKIYEEKYVANLIREFQLLRNNKNFDNLTEKEIIDPYMNAFGEKLKAIGLSDEAVQNLRKYVEKRIEAEIDVNSHPELHKKQTRIDSQVILRNANGGKKLDARVVRPEFSKLPKALRKVNINGREYVFRESDFPSEVRRNKNRLDFELIFNALDVYQEDINRTQLAVRPKKLSDRIVFGFKQLIAKFSKTNYHMSLDDKEFVFDSNELRKYASDNGQIADMANLAYGKYRNELTYPNPMYRTESDFQNLLSGQLVHISENGKNSEDILVFDHDLQEDELRDGVSKKMGYTRVSYEIFEQDLKKKKRFEIKSRQKTKPVSGQQRETNDKVIPFDKDRLRRKRSGRDGLEEM